MQLQFFVRVPQELFLEGLAANGAVNTHVYAAGVPVVSRAWAYRFPGVDRLAPAGALPVPGLVPAG
ncbi:hypothetical protein [Gleimia hominis]|uniref:hypothetical protein n=1 Tax=Gleimia hominis TaxID=595468 RepID=UPI0011AF400E|nr:hypothetical protein [Gleimia hominis]WIK64433.1 hypothetical protein CJ187_009070 [Gleimia hominis]